MIGFFQRVLTKLKVEGIPDDDLTIEDRYPKFPFVDNPTVRKMQRKCLIMAEYQRRHPEEFKHIERFENVLARQNAARKPRAGTPAQAQSDASADPELWFDFDGMVNYAPTSVRRGDD